MPSGSINTDIETFVPFSDRRQQWHKFLRLKTAQQAYCVVLIMTKLDEKVLDDCLKLSEKAYQSESPVSLPLQKIPATSQESS